MNLPKISVERPVLVNLICLLVLFGGIAAYRQMPQERFPDVSIEAVTVTTVMPGASPKEIEQLLTIPLEEQIAKVDEIDELRSTSQEGLSSIFVEFEPGVDLFEKITEIQNQIEKVERFPEEAENPSVIELKVAFDTVTVSVQGSAPEREVREFSEELEEQIKNLPGVDEVRVAGLRERELWVEVDPLRLYGYNLSLQDVAAALSRRNLNLPGGLIRMQRGEFAVRTEAEYQNVEQIRDTILRGDESQGYVYLRDVATVSDTYEERRSLARLDGRPAVNLVVKKSRDANAVDVVELVRAKVDEMSALAPAGISMQIVDDVSIEIKQRLRGLYGNLGLGLLLVIASFTVFIGWRPALMVAAGIPIAFFATFILLNAIGQTLNMLVLFGLILVLGLIVDDAIVVCENVYRHAEKGMPLARAAVFGSNQIAWPVIATVLTTIAAFLPLLLMTGVLGRFMSIIPIVVSLALAASTFEAFFILPAHIAEWGGGQLASSTRSRHKSAWMQGLLRGYDRLLGFSLRHRYWSVAATVLLAVACLNLAYARMDFILFGGRDLEAFSVAIEAPTSAAFEETTRVMDEVEEEALALATEDEGANIDSIRSEVGSLRRNGVGRDVGSNFAEVTVDLADLNARTRSGHEIKDELRGRLQSVTGVRSINFEEVRGGPPVGKPILVRVKGDSFDTLRLIADEVKAFLAVTEGVRDIIDSFPPGKDEVRPVLDMERLAATGLDVTAVAREVRGAFEGLEATRIYDGNEEVEVRVRFDAPNRQSIAGLQEMRFATPEGLIPFSNVGRIERQQGFAVISHHNQKRAVQVSADITEGVTTSGRVNGILIDRFRDIESRYPGYSLDFGGEYEDTQESVASMIRAFSITLVLIYVILGGLFQSFVQPLIVMVSVPFSFIGVIIGFFILGEPMGMYSTIGIIALCGIVVNDSLILIDFINRERSRGGERLASIRRAATLRLRPIILTSVTTIAGLLPMTLGLFGVDAFLRPMAIAIATGLSFATVLCLVVVPSVYAIFDDISLRLFRRPLGANLPRDDDGDHAPMSDDETSADLLSSPALGG